MLRRLSMTDGGNEQLATVFVQVSGDFGQQLRGKSRLRMTSSVNWLPARLLQHLGGVLLGVGALDNLLNHAVGVD